MTLLSLVPRRVRWWLMRRLEPTCRHCGVTPRTECVCPVDGSWGRWAPKGARGVVTDD